MSTPTATQQPAPLSALRRLVARHPVAAFLLMVYAVNIAVVLPPVLTRHDIWPFGQALSDPLGHIFGSAVPAFLVIAAMHGRAGVRDLARRCLRWRVGPQWYLFALLSVPVGVVVCASAIFGLAPLHARHGPLKASVIVTLPFALYHLPGLMVDEGLSLAQLPLALGLLGALAILQLFGRIVMMWLYNNTNRSVLLVGMFHSSFDATTAKFGRTIIPDDTTGVVTFIASGVVAVTAVLIVIFTRGRLSYTPTDAGTHLGTPPMSRQA